VVVVGGAEQVGGDEAVARDFPQRSHHPLVGHARGDEVADQRLPRGLRRRRVLEGTIQVLRCGQDGGRGVDGCVVGEDGPRSQGRGGLPAARGQAQGQAGQYQPSSHAHFSLPINVRMASQPPERSRRMKSADCSRRSSRATR